MKIIKISFIDNNNIFDINVYMEFNKTNHVLLEFGMNINKIQEYPSLKYNYCLHMRSTSCTSYKGNNCFILSKILLRC